MFPKKYWCSILVSKAVKSKRLAVRGDGNTLLVLSRKKWLPHKGSPGRSVAFVVSFGCVFTCVLKCYSLFPAAEEDAKMQKCVICAKSDDLRVSKTLQNYPWFLFFVFSFLFVIFSTFICTENAYCLP